MSPGSITSLNIISNTFSQNSAILGGGIRGLNCHSIVKNNILWKDSDSTGYPEICIYGDSAIVSYCDIQGGWPGIGNIDCDPWFCYPDTDNYYLAENSCCVGSGEDGVDIGAYGVGCPAYYYCYLPADANMYIGIWPPVVIGSDVTYLVNYFRGSLAGQPCYLGGFWASADANGDCDVIGSDVTKLVNYFRGQSDIEWCPDYPPLYPPIPPSEPEGWPNCE